MSPAKKDRKEFKKPRFCDLHCEYAAWPEVKGLDGSLSCRTFQAVYCSKIKMIVHKNGPCQA